MKINFHAWVRNKASVVDDMECDLTESSHRIKMKKKKRQWYNVADKNANAIPRCSNKTDVTKPRKLQACFPLNWAGQTWSLFCSLLYTIRTIF